MIHSVTVYCSASRRLAAPYYAAGEALGRALAANNWTLVYGGNNVGLMKSVADGVRSGGGKVIGITPRLMHEQGTSDTACEELLVTDTMRGRKNLLEQRGDAFIALPGGLGTFEELFEIIVGRQLGYHAKPIVLLNIENYYAPLLAMIEHGIDQQFIRTTTDKLFFVAQTVAEAVDYLRSTPAIEPTASVPTAAVNSAAE